ncbi:MAG: hypothetical protein LBI96_02045 [Odoribacteraceae bacterium]|jgi:ComF family protein|nr:hypothetical protein [Odoribacteraceae bacterium]
MIAVLRRAMSTVLREVVKYLEGILDLLYPRMCLVCRKVPVSDTAYICTRCNHYFPFSFRNHVKLELALMLVCPMGPIYSLMSIDRDSPYMQLVYAVKYHDMPRLAKFLGEMLGRRIEGKVSADFIVPMPLHPRRKRKRGFNQCTRVAGGISAVLHLPVREGVVRRTRNNPTQTKLNKGERARNVENLFVVDNPESLAGSRILLVEDVLTTGATISSCLKALNCIPDVVVSVACLARIERV